MDGLNGAKRDVEAAGGEALILPADVADADQVMAAAKAGIRGFTDSLRTELIHDKSNIRLYMVQMPALNTPQFGWCKSRMPHKAQPVPPIYQPEVAAEAIYFAAHHQRREMRVGFSTLKAMVGNMVIPGLLDVYLARTGYKAQQTDQPADPQRPDNLWAPVPADHGAHGAFDSRAKDNSPELWLAEHVRELAAAAAGVGALGAACTALLRRSR